MGRTVINAAKFSFTLIGPTSDEIRSRVKYNDAMEKLRERLPKMEGRGEERKKNPRICQKSFDKMMVRENRKGESERQMANTSIRCELRRMNSKVAAKYDFLLFNYGRI